MSWSTKIHNRKKYLLILGKVHTQGLEHTLNSEKYIQSILYSIRFCLSLHYNGANSYLFVNGREIKIMRL